MKVTTDINELVGKQELLDRLTDAGGILYYFDRSYKEDAKVGEINIRLMRHAFENGDGYVSPRDILLKLPEQVGESNTRWLCKNLALTSLVGLAKILEVDGLGRFAFVVGTTSQCEFPIYSYLDKNDIRRYIPSPLFETMVVRLNNVD